MAYSVRYNLFVIAAGVGIGAILTTVLDGLHDRLKTPRLLNAFFLIFAIIILFGTLGFFLFDLLADQVSSAIANQPQITAQATKKVAEILVRYPWIAVQFGQFDFGSALQNLVQRLSHGLSLGGTFVASTIISLAIGVYIAMNPVYYYDLALALVPENRRGDLGDLLLKISVNLRKWLFSQLLAMSTVGVATTFALWLIGVDYWFLFGVLSGLLDVVPYLGPIIPLTGLLVVNIAISPEKIPWIICAFIVIHQFENNFVVPLIFKYRMHFPPALLISTMIILGSLLGVLGLIVTPVLFSILQTTFIHYRKPQMDKTTPKNEIPAGVPT